MPQGWRLSKTILAALQTYIELSPSGEGFHAFGYLLDPNTIKRLGSSRQGLLGCIEIFFGVRFFTMTFRAWRDLPMVDLSPLISFIMDEHIRLGGTLTSASQILDDGITEPLILSGPPDDRDLLTALTETIEKLRALRPWDWQDVSRDLYIPIGLETDADALDKHALARQYLFKRMKNDHSDVDMFVASNVARFTGREDVFDAIMHRTGLYRTPGKASGKSFSYLRHTWKKAIWYREKVQRDRKEQVKQFHGCVSASVSFPTTIK